MAFRLRFEEDVPAGLRRLLADRIGSAARRLAEDYSEDPVEAVHRARTDLKKARAALRLAAPGMPASERRAADRALRDRGRALASTRDADVALATLEKLAEDLPAETAEALRAPLSVRAAASRTSDAGHLEQAEALRALARAAQRWPFDACDRATVARGLAESYRQGRDALATAESAPIPEHVHEWRKRVKDHWYQLRLVRRGWPAVIGAHADEARALSRLLGDDHDLAVFADLLGNDPALTEAVDTAPVLELIAARRAAAQAEAFRLGARLYAERPRALRRRMRRYLRAAAREHGERR